MSILSSFILYIKLDKLIIENKHELRKAFINIKTCEGAWDKIKKY